MLKFDEIGYWSEIKLEIVKEYAGTYSKILSAQTNPRFHHVYIDGFSGAGVHIAKQGDRLVQGSPLNALNIVPPFKEHFLIDLDGDKVEHLRQRVGDRKDVRIFRGNCNDVLLTDVFPHVQFQDYKRGLCLLDPYGLHLNWEVLFTAGQMGTIDLFLNFPIMDMNRNALWQNPEKASPDDWTRMTSFWGDESWRNVVYQESDQQSLFGTPDLEKVCNDEVAQAFRKRLKDVAGFGYVPPPMPMRNSKRAVVYYLFFASQKPVADSIVKDIFRKYATKGT